MAARQVYLLPHIRGKGLGKYLLQELEKAIAKKGDRQIWIEIATVLREYLDCGLRLGWLINPQDQIIEIYRFPTSLFPR